MRLNAKSRRSGRNRRTITDVQHGVKVFSANVDMRGINAVGRKQQSGHVQICGWKAKLLAELIAADDFAGERIGASEHLARGVEIAGANGLANARAADDLTVERHSEIG